MAGYSGFLARGTEVYPAVFRVFDNQSPCTDNAVSPQSYVIAQGDIDPQKTILPDRHAAGNHHMGRDETVVLDSGMMPDVVAAPQRHIVSYGDKRLNRVVLHNKTIVSHLKVRKGSGLGTDITDQVVSFSLCLPKLFSTESIHFGIT